MIKQSFSICVIAIFALLVCLAASDTSATSSYGTELPYAAGTGGRACALGLAATSLAGGRGTVIGTLIGALIVAFVASGLNMLNILSFWQDVLKGGILILAILMNERYSRRT